MPKKQDDPYLGQVLADRYRLEALAGSGSMGKVYRAEDQLLGGVTVAVKFLAQALLNDRMKERFAQEAQTGAQLGQRSLHIVRVQDYGVHVNDVPFYVMEFMEGQNLSDLIIPKLLDLPRFIGLMRHICLGLKCAHEGIKRSGQHTSIVHRDIKPSNVFVINDPSMGELGKVLDFGIAKFLSDQDASQSQSFMGTLAYCSPEQIEGKDLDGRSDIYSLGITMFEVLTGKMPIEPETHSIGSWYKAHRYKAPTKLAAAAPHLVFPKALVDLVMGCMEKQPENRPQSMDEILGILQALKEGPKPASSPSPTTLDKETPATATVPPESKKHSTVLDGPSPQTVTEDREDEPQQFLSVEDAGWHVVWPKGKPMAEIVFPQILQTQQQTAVALWVMLPQLDIQKRLLSARYNHFLCVMSPHPMVLWITTIYDSGLGARWLPCYLDLKSRRGQEMALLLGKTGYYPLIYFALEDAEQPVNVRSLAISGEQCKLFQEWVMLAQQVPNVGAASLSKQRLKEEFTKIKPKIIQKLEAVKPIKFIETNPV
jgi:serine/threonine-protein kinase